MNEKALFGTRIGAEDWQEELLTEVESRFEDAKKWAAANGFDPKKFRVVTVDGSIPDFTKTLKTRKK